jgi:outer membrane protein
MLISTGRKNTIWSTTVLIASCLLFGFSTGAQTEFSSIEDLFAYADENSLVLKNSGLNEQLYLSKNQESKADLLPNVDIGFGFNDNIALQPSLLPAQIFDPTAPEGEFTEITFGTKFTYSQNLNVQWDILNFQKIFSVEISKSDLLKSQANTELNRFNLYNQLASTYYSIILTQEAVEIYKENAATSETILENALNQLKKGVISESEYNRALINNRQINAQLSSNENALQQYYVQLQSQLHTDSIISINDDFDGFILSELSSFQTHPEILVQEADLMSVESQLSKPRPQDILL